VDYGDYRLFLQIGSLSFFGACILLIGTWAYKKHISPGSQASAAWAFWILVFSFGLGVPTSHERLAARLYPEELAQEHRDQAERQAAYEEARKERWKQRLAEAAKQRSPDRPLCNRPATCALVEVVKFD
jgi:hypothetical protein